MQVIAETCLALIKKAGASEDRIQNLILDFERQFHPFSIAAPHLRRGSLLRMRYNFSYWDSLMIVAALELKATIFYSEDIQDGLLVEGTLRIENPFKPQQ